MSRGRLVLHEPGEICSNADADQHILRTPAEDSGLQAVLDGLRPYDVAGLYTGAIANAIDYVLDGARTGRYDLLSPDVHPGEKASVGAKLEYEVLRSFNLPKEPPLDTVISGVPVDFKATVGANWAIPAEAQCQLCICTQIQLGRSRHRSWLVRAHRSWLYRGSGNRDGKRGLAVHAREHWSVPLYDWTPLPVNPLTLLTAEQASRVLAKRPGQERRFSMMFNYLEGLVVPRSVIATVGAGRHDPLRRARNIRKSLARDGLTLLCGKFPEQRDLAAAHKITLGPEDWIALRMEGDQDHAG
ncbi:NaeI family type II restriction endonuclease [Streptomyces sp. NBC_00249]|uniref:NaeI family type II restriction endonuclease n=1 Tax=Streptomyces sp. NBC_00249 TaxID=2975690 RepID=UPI0022581775|nr:NaeI family type II restriction endonuclease [Streptomyces sp. NBC_00249]MCX5198389.1 NaeI family type II restriction endonuclease [Streptomyces sp. NBC_00249]